MKEKKTKFNSFCVYLIMVIFFALYGSISVYAQTEVGDVWFVPQNSSVRINAGFTVDVNVNSGGQPLAAYGFEISFDAGMISVDTSVGTEGVVDGSDGYIAAANASTSGLLVVSGFDASGTGPGSNLHVITINFIAGGTTGTSSLELTVNDLYDADLNEIGTPTGINGSVTISEILLGDVDESGIVDIIDALLNAQAYVGLNPSGYNPAAADVNCDGSGDIVDSLLIAQYYVGLISEFPCSGETPTPTPDDTPTPTPTEPIEGVELLSNGDFSSGTNNWTINFYETAAGSSSVTGGELLMNIINGGTELWHIQITQGPITITQGANYAISFDARAAAPRTMEINVGMNYDPYTSYFNTGPVELTTTMTSYTFYLSMESATDTNSRLEINLGMDANNVYIDNISLQEVSGETPTPTETPVPTETPEPTLTPTPYTGDGAELVLNGDFSNGDFYWTAGFYESAMGGIYVRNGILEVEMSNGGGADWNVQILQVLIPLVNGRNYELSFDAWADTNRTIGANLEMAVDPYTSYMDTDGTINPISITTNPTTYTYSFTMQSASDDNARVSFNCGGNAAKVSIDNVSLIDLDSGSTPDPTTPPGSTPNPNVGTFPYSSNPYPYGINSAIIEGQGSEEAYLMNEYNLWKSSFVTSDGAGGNLRVYRPEENNDTVSEGIGYGMMLAVYFDDQSTFDGLWNYAKAYHDANGLMNWQIDQSGNIIGQNAATDADEDMAIALIFADRKWGGYSSDTSTLIGNMYNYMIEGGTYVVKPGDSWGGSNCTNISYFAPAEYKVFAQYTGNNGWNSVVDKCYEIINLAKNSTTNLVPDWCTAQGGTTSEASFDQYKDDYYYDAMRFPWRITLDYLWFGDSRAYDNMNILTGFFAGVGAPNIMNGYNLNGNVISTFHDPCFVTTTGCGAMASNDIYFAQRMYVEVKRVTLYANYYQSTLRLLGLLMMSGNCPNIADLVP